MNDLSWLDVLKREKESPGYMYQWFLTFQDHFNNVSDYKEKLKLWYDIGLQMPTYIINGTEQTTGGLVAHPDNIKEQSVYPVSVVTIVPKDEEEFDMYFWASVERGMQKLGLDDVNAERLIVEYWQTMRVTPSDTGFLNDELERVDQLFKKYESDNTSLINSMFNRARKWTLRGKNAINEFYHESFKSFKRSIYQTDSDTYFIHIARGIAYTYYKSFLGEQKKRMDEGDDIRKQDSNNTMPIVTGSQDTNYNDLIGWGPLSTDQTERFTLNFDKFLKLKDEFDKLENYQAKLNFWSTNNINGLTHVINLAAKTVSTWLDKYYKVYQLHNIQELRCISIEPQSPEQCKEFIIWNIEKNDLNGCNDFRCYSQSMINLYWERILKVPAYREYPKNQLLEIERFIENQKKASKEILSALFIHSYNNCMNGLEPFDYNELYRLLFFNPSHHDIHLLGDSCILFPNLLRGKAYAEYRGFLFDQIERANRGEDIRQPKDSYTGILPSSDIRPTHKQQVLIAYYLEKHSLITFTRYIKETKFVILNSLFGRGVDYSNTKTYYNSVQLPKDPQKVMTPENLKAILPYFVKLGDEVILNEIKRDLIRFEK